MPTPARNHRGADGCPREGGDLDPVGAFALNLRAPVFALSAVLLSVAAHIAGGGGVPGSGTIGLLVVAVALVFRTLVRRELSLVRVMLGVVVAQIGLHVVLAAGHANHPTGRAMGHPSGHPTGRAMEHAASHAIAGLPDEVLMPLTHVAAAVVLAWWLHRGEVAVWRGARHLILTLLQLPAAVRVERSTVHRRTRTGPRPAGPLVLVIGAHPRRGPPLAA